jgi:hypothetical protein
MYGIVNTFSKVQLKKTLWNNIYGSNTLGTVKLKNKILEQKKYIQSEMHLAQ